MMKAILGALAALALLAPTAGAAPWTPPMPKKGHAGFKWHGYGCKTSSNGSVRAYGTIDSWVRKLPSGRFRSSGLFYQKIKVQIDKQVGFSDARPDWRQVDGSSGVERGADGGKIMFQKTLGLPNSVRYTHSTGIFPDHATLTAKATIWLKRNLWPKAVWRYKVRSKPFQCNPNLPDMLPAAPAPPSAGGGGPITEIG